MVKKNKKSKRNQTSANDEKPKTKLEYMSDATSAHTPKDVGSSTASNAELPSDDLTATNKNLKNVEEVIEMQSGTTTEDDKDVKRDRPMMSRKQRGKFQAANHLLGLNIPSGSRGNDAHSIDCHSKSAAKQTDVSKYKNNDRDSLDSNFKQKQVMSHNEKSMTASSRSTCNERSFCKSGPGVNKSYDEWQELMKSTENKAREYTNVIEVFGDLFTAPNDYSLGHCVAEDMNMGSGIATTFRSLFKNVAELLQQGQKQGGLAVLENNGRFIYYLVTKPYSSGKPTYETLFRSLVKMRHHIIENNVKKVALPQIGCGLDNLEWSIVKPMLQFIFEDVDIEIKIYNFQKDPYGNNPPNKQKKCHVVNVLKPIKEIEDYTIIIYPCTVENYITDVMTDLDEKFRVLKDYRSSNRTLGTVIRTTTYGGKYIVYGAVVKDGRNDKINYKHFQTCLYQINKDNRKDQFEYVAIQAFQEPSDDMVMTKLVNLMRNSLVGVDVYVCWPKSLERYAPNESRYY